MHLCLDKSIIVMKVSSSSFYVSSSRNDLTVNNGILKKAVTDDVIFNLHAHVDVVVACCSFVVFINHDCRCHHDNLPTTTVVSSSANHGIRSPIIIGGRLVKIDWPSCSTHYKLSYRQQCSDEEESVFVACIEGSYFWHGVRQLNCML